jgi:hypothetical protein
MSPLCLRGMIGMEVIEEWKVEQRRLQAKEAKYNPP